MQKPNSIMDYETRCMIVNVENLTQQVNQLDLQKSSMLDIIDTFNKIVDKRMEIQ